MVSTRVLAGSVASPLQVLAYIDLNENGAQEPEDGTASKVLVVSTGVADQNSISLSARHANPYGTGGVCPRVTDLINSARNCWITHHRFTTRGRLIPTAVYRYS